MNLTIATIDKSRGNQINETKATKRFFQNCRRFKIHSYLPARLKLSENRCLPSRENLKKKALHNCALTQAENKRKNAQLPN